MQGTNLDRILHRLVMESKMEIRQNRFIATRQSSGFICSVAKKLITEAIQKSSRPVSLNEANDDDVKVVKVRNELLVNGGYGTVSRLYAQASYSRNMEYGKAYTRFIALGSSASFIEPEDNSLTARESSVGEIVSSEVVEKAAKHLKYFVPGEIMGDVGLVTPVGMNINSKDWEKYRLMSQISFYKPLLAIKNFSA